MQKFTRALTREVEVGGERLAVTFSLEGLSVRPVGSRRAPHTLSWAACACAVAGRPVGGREPSHEELAEAVKTLKAGAAGGGARRAPSDANAEPQREGKEQPEPAHQPAGGHEGHEHHAEAKAEEAGETTEGPSSAPAGQHAAGARPAGGNGQSLPELLRRLDAWLARHRKGYHSALRPGATSEQLQALERELGRPLPEELRTLLGWHNGQDPDQPGALVESWNLMSTEDVARAARELAGQSERGWNASWIPFLDDDQDDYVCLDPTQPGNPVREVWRGTAEHPAVAPSLTAWVAQLLQGVEAGAYVEDPERGSFHRKSE